MKNRKRPKGVGAPMGRANINQNYNRSINGETEGVKMKKEQMAYLPLKEYAEGKTAIARIEAMKECLLRGDYVETSEKISNILGIDTEKGQTSYLPVGEYTKGLVAIASIQSLKNIVINSSYGVTKEIIAGALGIQLPDDDKKDE